jgi:hypothetical protein
MSFDHLLQYMYLLNTMTIMDYNFLIDQINMQGMHSHI